jgi:hypothetical protein
MKNQDSILLFLPHFHYEQVLPRAIIKIAAL